MKNFLWCLLACLACVVFGITAIVAGITNPFWYINANGTNTSFGLLRRCAHESVLSQKNCNKDGKLFKFDKDLDLDMILLLFCCASLFGMISLISTCLMFCCQKNRKSWICCSLLNMGLVFISVGCGVGGAVYNELVAKFPFSYKKGWSLIMCWAGVCLLFVSVFLFIAMACIGPQERVSDEIELHQIRLQSRENGKCNVSYER